MFAFVVFALFAVAGPARADVARADVARADVARADVARAALKAKIDRALKLVEARPAKGGANAPSPELGEAVRAALDTLANDPEFEALAKADRGIAALRTQTLNHLEHVSFDFEMGAKDYTHDFVLEGPYPRRPTVSALRKTQEFLRIMEAPEAPKAERVKNDPTREKALMDEQKALAKKITENSFEVYKDMRGRLVSGGIDASFPEFRSLVESLELKVQTDATVGRMTKGNKRLSAFRTIALEHLQRVKSTSLPYGETLDAVQRTLEFLDVVHRAADPKRSPKLYHSGRYEYYTHYLAGEVPDHITMPTLASLGATDLLKTRGVPIGFVGVNTDIAYVDGYHQTPYEFYVHDINHTRRMFQFFKEEAGRQGKSIEAFAKESDAFVREKLLPLISIAKTDDDLTKNQKRLRKVLLFEVMHEDALPAAPNVIAKAILRAPKVLTPFEKIEGKKVVYLMEPGATTLAYVYRKLAHDFYDMPAERFDNIVSPDFRTRKNIVEAAEAIFGKLGVKPNRAVFEQYVANDEGFPDDFRSTLERDHAARRNATPALIDTSKVIRKSVAAFLEQQKVAIPGKLDAAHAPFIKWFVHNGETVTVSLELTLEGGQKIDYMLHLPQEQLAVDRTVGTVDQIKGSRRVLELESGGTPHMLAALRTELLGALDPKEYWVVLKASDPKVTELLEVAREAGFETILVGSAAHPVRYSKELPSFYVMAADDQAHGRTWDGLVANDAENGARHTRLDLSAHNPPSLRLLAKSLESARKRAATLLAKSLNRENVQVLGRSELAKVLAGKTPVLFSGASQKSWPLISVDQQVEVTKAVRAALDHLDPAKTLIVTGATDYGVEKIVHEEAKKRGFQILGTVVEAAQVHKQEIGPVDYVTPMGHTWYGKSRPALELVKEHGGAVIFMGGGAILRDEIGMAKELGVQMHLMEGPEGAADEMAKAMPEHAFRGGAGLVGRLEAARAVSARPAAAHVTAEKILNTLQPRPPAPAPAAIRPSKQTAPSLTPPTVRPRGHRS